MQTHTRQNGFFTGALFFVLTFSGSAFATTPLKIMTFNTMCKMCDSKKKAGPFAQRLLNLAETVRRHDPDLISFQELQSKKHVRKMSALLEEKYTVLFEKKSLYPGTDATLFIRKSRFEVVKSGGVWLGPRLPKFSFGWKPRIPRRFHWAQLKDNESGNEFIFAGSHFDNSFQNKNPSAAWANSFFQASKVPVLFGGDSNLMPRHPGYSVLTESMRDAFDEKGELKYYASGEYSPDDGCGDHGDKFPDCRIDHVLMSPHAPWRVKTWGVDVYRYFKGTEFVSDHRAVIVELE